MNYAIFALSIVAVIAFFLRGGKLHTHLALQTESLLNRAGFETRLEHPEKLPDGRLDFVDILARRGEAMIFVEIETTPRYVLTNAAKAERLGIPLIIVVPSKKVQKEVKARLRCSGLRPGGEQICILLLNHLNKELMN
ncbi:hypothetical protein SMSP2_01282 [Limihaloglobus sulfuriphilus]|uniref:DUF2726 domain-containing protein n=1 Tax=Limihaloglobus sulfuriphilus TaxID=1851148 RepID=A0A1Q2ME41_9BACT|nr:hypothetical protein [Limihaloglobus sulfuriphilus]AQQ70919.1 hypothetical protein SMSP2_01282 [Limihaloglobus sulfuriphilus]